jgi:hypothetical protein
MIIMRRPLKIAVPVHITARRIWVRYTCAYPWQNFFTAAWTAPPTENPGPYEGRSRVSLRTKNAQKKRAVLSRVLDQRQKNQMPRCTCPANQIKSPPSTSEPQFTIGENSGW